MMYNKHIHLEYCSYKSLNDIHNHFTNNLRITDRPLSELLEAILFIKATAGNREKNYNVRLYIYIYDGAITRILTS